MNELNSMCQNALVIVAGDFNTLNDKEFTIKTGLLSIVNQPTRGTSQLDRIYVSELCFDHVKVLNSSIKSDHKAVIAYTGSVKITVNKSRGVKVYRKITPSQHASCLAHASSLQYIVNKDNDVQQEFDRFYTTLINLLDCFYPERSVIITSADPGFVTPAVKAMLRRKNRLMRRGRIEQAEALAHRIGRAIIRYNSVELSRVDPIADSRSMWAKVRQLTGRSRAVRDRCHNSAITAKTLNEHYALLSTDSAYTPPLVKSTAFEGTSQISECEIFDILDRLRPTASGMDGIPAWFLRLAAPVLAAPIADLFNISLASSCVPLQWKRAAIHPIPKTPSPSQPADFRPISVTPVLCRVLERIVVRQYIYPALLVPSCQQFLSDQFGFRPFGSTTAALITILQTITSMLASNSYVIVYSIDFSKAFDTVRHSSLFSKYASLDLPDFIYNWLESFFRDHSHCTQFDNQLSDFLDISASIIQGSVLGPASYVVTASDLRPLSPLNVIVKYADDTYLIIPASNQTTCQAEIQHIEQWGDANHLKLNRAKSNEIVFVKPRSWRHVDVPPPAVEGFARVQQISALGVTLCYNLSMSVHTDNIITGCARILYGLRTLRSHGMPTHALHSVFQATAIAKLTYAAPAWWGFTNASDRNRFEAFLRRAIKLGFCADSTPTWSSICDQADRRLFVNVINNPTHPLHDLLPPKREKHYSTRTRAHEYQLPLKSTALDECNFIYRCLYRDVF